MSEMLLLELTLGHHSSWVSPCHCVMAAQNFETARWPHLQGFKCPTSWGVRALEGKTIMLVRNVMYKLPSNMAQYLSRTETSTAPL
jgi:hypothetical protein